RPVLSDLCKKIDVDLNIRAGGIQNLPGKKIGTMITDITGSKENVEKALAYLKERGILVEDAEEEK
ncbi:MAG: NIL domain-containing protein, partial [Treponema sp.]|nr:NIL domain-containing protein [Treponema sp.]